MLTWLVRSSLRDGPLPFDSTLLLSTNSPYLLTELRLGRSDEFGTEAILLFAPHLPRSQSIKWGSARPAIVLDCSALV